MRYKGFYKKDIKTRKALLKEAGRFDDNLNQPLEVSIYDHMIENAIGVFEVPLGVVPELTINDKIFAIPMATEESSVIAALNHGSKIVNMNGGVSSTVKGTLLRGEVIIANPSNIKQLKACLNDEPSLIEVANKAHPSIVNRGGGVVKFEIRTLIDKDTVFVILDVLMDTQEAMGANMMNTVLEKLAQYIETKTGETVLMAILSNLSPESVVKAQVSIDPKTLKFSQDTAKRIALSSQLTQLDRYRCATHNKGVMNGIDAVVLASGNDTRAINANIYSYFPNQPITRWSYQNGLLKGDIEIPLTVGTVGGAVSIHNKAKLFKKISGYEHKEDLMHIIAAVGLTQNFAALYALNTDGIQKGHMSLHAKNILIGLNCPSEHLDKATQLLLKEPHINTETAKSILKDLLKK